MGNFFDSSKLSEILKDYFNVTRIRIAILDTNYRDINGYPKKKATLCEYIRTSKEADACCRECDRKACMIAKDSSAPYMYQCHAGLYEIISPLMVNGIVVGYLFFAHMLSDATKDQCYKRICERTEKFNLDKKIIKKLLDESVLLQEDYIKSAAHLLETIATFLCMEKMGFVKKYDNLPILINKYILEHITEEIEIKDICRALGIGKTKLSEVSTKYFGTGIHEHIRSIRINKAKEILTNEQDTPIDDVAQRCGFSDYNYFISIFKKMVGTTPKKFMKSNQNDAFNSLSYFDV